MKNTFRCLLFLLAAFAGSQQAAAQGTAFAYQGQLQDNGNLANGLYDFQFSLSNAPSGGSQLGSSVTNLAIVVTNGVFATTLDFGAVFTGNPTWLAISVCSNGVGNFVGLTPLQPLTPVPYAIFANTASNLSGSFPATQLSGAVGNGQLANNAITLFPGPGLIGGGTVALGGSTTLSNAGVLSVTGNTDITASTVGGAVTLGDTANSTNTANAIVKRDASGNFSAGAIAATSLSGAFIGDGSALTNIPFTGLQAVPLTNAQSGVSFNGLTTVSNLAVKATNYANYLEVSNAPALNGSAITNLNAFQLASGTLPLARLPGVVLTNAQSNVTLDGLTTVSNLAVKATNYANYLVVSNAPALNGSAITNLNASQLASGTLPLARLPGAVLTNTQNGVTLNGWTTVSNLAVTATNYANYLVVSNAPALNGSAFTSLNASQLSSGMVPLAQLNGITSNQLDATTWQLATNINGGNAALASNVVSGLILTNAFLTNALLTNSVFAGDGSGLINLNASQLNSGTVPLAQMPGEVLTNNQSGVTLNDLTTVSNLTVAGTNFVNYLVVSNASALDGSAITGLNASQLSSGTVPLAQLSGITSNQLDVMTWQLATNLDGGNAALASNVISGLNLTNAFLTNAVITSSVFAGDGSSLINLNASQLSSGTLPLAQLPGEVLTNTQSGVTLDGLTTVSNLAVTATNYANYLVVSNAPALNGSAFTGLNASQLASGTVPLARMPGAVLTNTQSGVTLNGLTTVSNLAVKATNYANYLVVSNAPALNGSAIINLDAFQLASGTVPLARLPGAVLTNTQSGVTLNGLTTVSNLAVKATNYANYLVVSNAPTLNGSAITNLNASQLASGTVPLARLPGVVLTNTQNGVTFNGLITVSNLAVTATNYANYLVVSNAPALNGSAITSLNASQLASGTVPLAQLSGLTSNQLDAATWQLATNLNGGNAALASNVVSGLNITNAFITSSVFAGDGSAVTNLSATSLVGVMTGNLSLSNWYGMTNVFDGDSYTRGDGSLPYSMPLGVQQMTGIPSVNFGLDGITTYQILTNFQSNTWAWCQPNVIWAGNNDQYAFTPAANVVSNIGVMVADMALSNNSRYLVLSTINDYTNQGIGTPVYIYFTNLNALLQSTFTNHYIDIRAWMVENYNPNSLADQYGLTNDSPPTSEWNIPADHPNALGESLIANKVLENAYWLNISAPLTTASVQEQIQNTLSQPVIFGNSISVATIYPPAYNSVIFTDPANNTSLYFNPSLEEIWTSFGTLGFNGNNLNNIGALSASSVTADISGSTDANGNPPLFSASATPNDASALTGLNASQLASGTISTNVLPAPLAGEFWHTNSPTLTMTKGAKSVLTTTSGSVGFGGTEYNDYSGFIVLTNGTGVGTNTAGFAFCTNTFAYAFSVAPPVFLMWTPQYGTATAASAITRVGPTDIYAISSTTNFVLYTTAAGSAVAAGTSYCVSYSIPNNWQ